MKSNRLRAVSALILAAIIATVWLALASGTSRTHSVHTSRDRDKASDCWTRPDRHGHRHCDSR